MRPMTRQPQPGESEEHLPDMTSRGPLALQKAIAKGRGRTRRGLYAA